MGVQTSIRNDAPAGSAAKLKVVVVTVARPEAEEQRHVLDAQQGLTLELAAGQFVMVDETEKEFS